MITATLMSVWVQTASEGIVPQLFVDFPTMEFVDITGGAVIPVPNLVTLRAFNLDQVTLDALEANPNYKVLAHEVI